MMTLLSITSRNVIIFVVVVVVVFFDTDRGPYGIGMVRSFLAGFIFLSANIDNVVEGIIDHEQ